VVEAGRKSGVPGRGMAFPSFWFAIRRPSVDALARTVVGEEALLCDEEALQVWGPELPFIVMGPVQLPLEDLDVRGVAGCFWAVARVQVRTSTQPKSVAILVIINLLRRGVLPLAWYGSDHASWFPKIV
jgi:hypothetical protein